jgi:hypothetical protein
MALSKTKKETAKALLIRLKKEMARPRVVESAQKKFAGLAISKRGG